VYVSCGAILPGCLGLSNLMKDGQNMALSTHTYCCVCVCVCVCVCARACERMLCVHSCEVM